MPHYRVELEGRNFVMIVEGATTRVGFFVTRFVEAADRSDVEQQALEILRQEPSLADVRNDADDPPMVYVNDAAPVSANDVPAVPPGFVFFPYEPET